MLTNKLKQFRKQKYRTQSGFAEIMGVHVNSYMRYENNKSELPVTYTKRLGDYFEINWWEFYEDELADKNAEGQ